jgi:hypothetical protein
MKTQCEICQSYKKNVVDPEHAENNPCFEERSWKENYRPKPWSGHEIQLTCRGFSHIQSGYIK